MDQIPGLLAALVLPETDVEVTAILTDGEEIEMRLALPGVRAALVLKAHAYRDRFADRDAQDVHRLLEAAHAAGHRADDWPAKASMRDGAHYLHEFFGWPQSPALGRLRRMDATRVPLLVRQVVPVPAR